MARHLILLGDSIFDNAIYVPGGTAVVEHVQQQLPAGDRVSLVAVDGNITVDVLRQIERMPRDATHLAVSVGGNDALRASGILQDSFLETEQLFRELAAIQDSFANDYRTMLRAVLDQQRPTVVCTIYDSIPDMQRWQLAALSNFNDTIIREAALVGVPVLDLRPICNEASDYAVLSPIEPSTAGGRKIAQALVGVLDRHDFRRQETVMYTR